MLEAVVSAVVPARRQTADDACPGALRLHAAADGPLARVRLPGGLLTGRQLGVLADLAAEHGDGAIELTSRANVQLRALRTTGEELATRLAEAGLLPSLAHETVRNIVAPPLADAAMRDLVAALDQGLCADPDLAALPGRFLFALGRTPLAADVAAVPLSGSREWVIMLGGADVGLRVEADRVVPTMLAAAHVFLAERARHDPKPWRLREIPDGPELIAARLPIARSAVRGRGAGLPEPRPFIGVLDHDAVGALVPLGRLTAVPIKVLARAQRLVVTPWGGVVVPDLAPAAKDRWLRELRAAGLATEGDSKWAGVTTCAGRPGCGKALADVRAEATAAARFVAGLPVHWVGCARGCGSPGGEHVRVEATADGYLVNGEPVGRAGLGEVVAARRA
jgi:precorrin-3B synthase